MKRWLQILLVVTGVIFSSDTISQDSSSFRLGLTIQPELTTSYVVKGVARKLARLTGYGGGQVIYSPGWKARWCFESGLYFTDRGTGVKLTIDNSEGSYIAHSSTHYYFLDFPLLLRYSYRSFYAGIGPHLSYIWHYKYRLKGEKELHRTQRPGYIPSWYVGVLLKFGYRYTLTKKVSINGGVHLNPLLTATLINMGVNISFNYRL